MNIERLICVIWNEDNLFTMMEEYLHLAKAYPEWSEDIALLIQLKLSLDLEDKS